MNKFQQSISMNTKEKPKGGIIAAFLGAMVTVVSIGVFHMIGHANSGFNAFLKFHEGIGPLSGKIVLAYILGFVVFCAAYLLLRKKQKVNLIVWFILLMIALFVGT